MSRGTAKHSIVLRTKPTIVLPRVLVHGVQLWKVHRLHPQGSSGDRFCHRDPQLLTHSHINAQVCLRLSVGSSEQSTVNTAHQHI